MSKKQITGTVISDKMQKTVVVGVETVKRHPVYKKNIKRTKRFFARDELGCKHGDLVLIEEANPFSKKVTWVVVKNLSGEKERE